MNFENVLKTRQSTRKFKDIQITSTELENVIEAGNIAPVGSNLYKDVHLTVVQDQELLLHLCEAAWARFSTREKVEEIAGDTLDKNPAKAGAEKPNLFYGAPTVIFVSHRKQDLQPGIEWSNVTSVVNQMHLAATAMGLGSCYMWGALESMRMIPELDHTEALNLPEGFEPLLALAIGYPDEPLEKSNKHHERISINYIG